MINKKQQFITHTSHRCIDGRSVRCAMVYIGGTIYKLPVGYTKDEFNTFLNDIDQTGKIICFDGAIWYTGTDSIWSSVETNKNTYEQWWQTNIIPQIPDYLLNKNSV